ncbi:hypothetical protein E4U14_000908 [Claviceps sp. LM454 group G7]|nr:hypothetical protein E4U14_000908 [Claviceps sp. LM454 group G7]
MAPTGEAEAAAREIGLLPGYQRPGARQGAKTGVEPPRNGDNGWGLVNSHGLEMGPERERLGGHGSPARRHQLLAAASALSSEHAPAQTRRRHADIKQRALCASPIPDSQQLPVHAR